MRTILDQNDLPLDAENAADFNRQLVKEEHNITEVGELQAVQSLRKAFSQLSNGSLTPGQLKYYERDTRKYLRLIDVINYACYCFEERQGP